MTFRPYQQEAFDAIIRELSINAKCIVKMFCGSGKSVIMHEVVKYLKPNLSVFVFPSLSLIDQFYSSYLDKTPNILRISSDNDSTTDPYVITEFLNDKFPIKIICITYQSFNTLLDNLQDRKIDICCFDEAHNAIGNTYQNAIFNNDLKISKSVFFTATPKNANGITMYNKNEPHKSMCGNLVYEYSYLQGTMEGYLNPFEIRVDLFSKDDNKSIYESIARAILTTGNSRVLTFHTTVNSQNDSTVVRFVNEEKFKQAFEHVVQTEFKDKMNLYKQITMIGLDCKTTMKQRRQILLKFKNCDGIDNEKNIIILSSCETIGEGVDTNDANMCVFVEPKSSAVKIIQNIGRIVRKKIGDKKNKSTILIPCWIDVEKYRSCNNDKEKCDGMIRDDMMTSGGNFNKVLNVLSSLQKEQEDIYDACLNRHNLYTYNEIAMNFTTQGYEIGDAFGSGSLFDTIQFLLDKKISYIDEDDDDCINQITINENICIEIHTDDKNNPVTEYNFENGGIVIRLYKTDNIYKPLIKKNGEKKGNKLEKLNSIDVKKKVNIVLHASDDIKVLWNIKQLDDNSVLNFKSCILDCEFIDIWREKFDKLKEFVIINNRKPCVISRNKEELFIAYWFNIQNINYTNKNHGMTSNLRYNTWTNFINDFKYLFTSIYDVWENKFDEKKYSLLNHAYVWGLKMRSLKDFIVKFDRKPSIVSQNKWETILGQWFHIQNEYYKILHQNKIYEKLDETRVLTNFYEDRNSYICDKQFYSIWTDLKQKLIIKCVK